MRPTLWMCIKRNYPKLQLSHHSDNWLPHFLIDPHCSPPISHILLTKFKYHFFVLNSSLSPNPLVTTLLFCSSTKTSLFLSHLYLFHHFLIQITHSAYNILHTHNFQKHYIWISNYIHICINKICNNNNFISIGTSPTNRYISRYKLHLYNTPPT